MPPVASVGSTAARLKIASDTRVAQGIDRRTDQTIVFHIAPEVWYFVVEELSTALYAPLVQPYGDGCVQMRAVM